MRRPSPALVVAMVALFVALGGAGFAASLVAFSQVRAPKPLTLVPGSVSADGKVTGPRLSGERASTGVYTLTIRGDTFAGGKTFAPGEVVVSPLVIDEKGIPKVPPTCEVANRHIASDGSATAEVDCFTYGAAGWQPTDAAFDVQFRTLSHGG